MAKTHKEKLKEHLNRQIERISRRISLLEGWSSKYSYTRLVYFFIGILILYFTSSVVGDVLFFLFLSLFLGGFIWLVIRHNRVRQNMDQLSFLRQVKEEQVARMNLDWQNLPAYSFNSELKNHSFADDLNIVGKSSLHHLMDTAIYEGGSTKLAGWLLEEHPDQNSIRKRQKLVQELTNLNLFRDRLQVRSFITKKDVSDKDWTMDRLLKWLRIPQKINFALPLTVLSILSVTNILLALLAIAGVIGPYVLITFIIYLGIYNFNSHKITGLFDAAFQTDKLLNRFGEILLYVEQFRFTNAPGLQEFCKVFKNPDDKPSNYLKKVSKLAGAASLQKNQVLWPLVNMVIPWDMYYSMKMEKLKVELEPKLTIWLNTFYELEALNSIANFSFLNPNYSFAEVKENDVDLLFDAKGLGHPLIPESEKVTNNFSVQKGRDLFLITGSNMAGKSTFLRTVGINLCLCFAGAPVNAESLHTKLFRLFTSINVKDSLGEGLSHFYAEVKRLKKLLAELDKEKELPLFFFVDEIFKGTNNRERFQGSTAFLKKVAGKNGAGMVSTHDLELASLEKEISQLSNWHFEETIEGGKMSFEYKIKSGPCSTTNALKIMQMEGLPVK
ncbi:MAG: hypothetical protein WD059_01040 [Balneolaceae bacterium]